MRRLVLVGMLAACSRHHQGKIDPAAATQLFDTVKLEDVPPGISAALSSASGAAMIRSGLGA